MTDAEPRTCECDRPGLFNRAAWACWVGPEIDGDGLPSTLHVGPTDGAHVHESDAEEVRQRLRSGAAPLDTAVDRLLEVLDEYNGDLSHGPTEAWAEVKRLRLSEGTDQ